MILTYFRNYAKHVDRGVAIEVVKVLGKMYAKGLLMVLMFLIPGIVALEATKTVLMDSRLPNRGELDVITLHKHLIAGTSSGYIYSLVAHNIAITPFAVSVALAVIAVYIPKFRFGKWKVVVPVILANLGCLLYEGRVGKLPSLLFLLINVFLSGIAPILWSTRNLPWRPLFSLHNFLPEDFRHLELKILRLLLICLVVYGIGFEVYVHMLSENFNDLDIMWKVFIRVVVHPVVISGALFLAKRVAARLPLAPNHSRIAICYPTIGICLALGRVLVASMGSSTEIAVVSIFVAATEVVSRVVTLVYISKFKKKMGKSLKLMRLERSLSSLTTLTTHAPEILSPTASSSRHFAPGSSPSTRKVSLESHMSGSRKRKGSKGSNPASTPTGSTHPPVPPRHLPLPSINSLSIMSSDLGSALSDPGLGSDQELGELVTGPFSVSKANLNRFSDHPTFAPVDSGAEGYLPGARRMVGGLQSGSFALSDRRFSDSRPSSSISDVRQPPPNSGSNVEPFVPPHSSIYDVTEDLSPNYEHETTVDEALDVLVPMVYSESVFEFAVILYSEISLYLIHHGLTWEPSAISSVLLNVVVQVLLEFSVDVLVFTFAKAGLGLPLVRKVAVSIKPTAGLFFFIGVASLQYILYIQISSFTCYKREDSGSVTLFSC